MGLCACVVCLFLISRMKHQLNGLCNTNFMLETFLSIVSSCRVDCNDGCHNGFIMHLVLLLLLFLLLLPWTVLLYIFILYTTYKEYSSKNFVYKSVCFDYVHFHTRTRTCTLSCTCTCTHTHTRAHMVFVIVCVARASLHTHLFCVSV